MNAHISKKISSLESEVISINSKLDSVTALMSDSLNRSGICKYVKVFNNTFLSLPVHTCGGTGGWRHAVYLDMTDPNTDCPCGWREAGYSKRTCGRATDGSLTCDTVTFPVSGGEYSQV